jgi:uncharacterized protein (TIGR04255 family)
VHPLPEIKFPQLTRPPLREALVDIRLREMLPATWVERLENEDFGNFTNPQPMKQSAFKLMVPKDEPARALVDSDQPFGRRYNSKDETRVLQVRRNGMTLSILKNYANWDALRDSARASWERYLEISGPVDVDRLAVRYINAIEIAAGDDYDKYLTTGPRIPRDLPQIVSNFIQRVEIPFTKEEATAIITQTLGQPVGGQGSVILDIDVFCQCALKGTSQDVWSTLDNLRDIANGIFFSSVAPEVLKSYL